MRCPTASAPPTRSTETGRLGHRLGHGKQWGDAVEPNPTDRGKPGTKRHVIVDRRGAPLAVRLTGANRHDRGVFEDGVDAIRPIRRSRGRPRKRQAKLHADTADDISRCSRALPRRHITIRIARKGGESRERLGRHR